MLVYQRVKPAFHLNRLHLLHPPWFLAGDQRISCGLRAPRRNLRGEKKRRRWATKGGRGGRTKWWHGGSSEKATDEESPPNFFHPLQKPWFSSEWVGNFHIIGSIEWGCSTWTGEALKIRVIPHWRRLVLSNCWITIGNNGITMELDGLWWILMDF